MKKETEPSSDKKNKSLSFISNSKYYTISIYTIITVLICALIVRTIFMWESTSTALKEIFSWTFPYLLGVFLAFLLYPMAVFMEEHIGRLLPENRKKLGRGLAILFTYIGFLGVIVLVIGVIIPQVWRSILDMTALVPVWYSKLMILLNDLEKLLPEINFDLVTKHLQEFGNSFLSSSNIQEQLQNIVVTVISTSVSVVSVLIDLFITLIVSIYLLIDQKRIARACCRILRAFASEERTAQIIQVSGECYDIFSRFVSGKMIDSLIMGILCFIVMNILRLPYALIISVVVGVTNMIPYFGPFIGAVPGAFIVLMVSPVKMLIYIVMVFVLQQFDGLYLGPKILGDSTGLRPAWILVAVSAGGATAGVLGMFLGVPVVAVIGHLINLWIEFRLKKKKDAGEIGKIDPVQTEPIKEEGTDRE